MVYNQSKVLNLDQQQKKRLMAEDILQEKLFALICSIKKRDEKAFSDFYDLTVNRVYGLAYKILGNKDDSEEAVCDVYSQIWQQAENYCPERGSMLGWYLLMARCRSLDIYRKRRTHKEIIQDSLDYIESIADEETEPDKVIQLFQENDRTQMALKQLSLSQRQLISLAFIKGLTHSEISEAIGMPLGTVKSNIRRSLELLQSKMRS